jgi:hypothetical protein
MRSPRRTDAARRPPRKSFLSKPREVCLTAARQIWETEGRRAQTVRQYYYRLKALGVIKLLDVPNSSDNAYKFTSRLLTEARRIGPAAGGLPWSAVIDQERAGVGYWYADQSLASSITMEGSSFRVDYWRGQSRRLAIWTEHKGLAESLASVAGKYHIRVNVTKGYASQSVIYQEARTYGNGTGWTLLYVGDFDPSGLDIQRAFEETLAEHGCFPEIVRVAITEDQIAELDATAAEPVKGGDSRAEGFVARYGPVGYQAEAMRTSALHKLLRDIIESYVDASKMVAAQAIEDAANEYVTEVIEEALNEIGPELLENGVPDLDYPLNVQRFFLGAEGEYEDPDISAAEAAGMDAAVASSYLGLEDEDEDEDDEEGKDEP